MRFKWVFLALFVLMSGATGFCSDLYPPITKWSLGDLASKTQRAIATGTELPEVASAVTGELFLRFPRIATDTAMPGVEWAVTQWPSLFMLWDVATWTWEFGFATGPMWFELGGWDGSRMPRGTALPDPMANPRKIFLKFADQPELWVSSYTNDGLGYSWKWLQLSGGSFGSGTAGVATHSMLAGLDYDSSGHTGFARSSDLPVNGSFSHDLLADVTSSTGHDGRYVKPGDEVTWAAHHTFSYWITLMSSLSMVPSEVGTAILQMENATGTLEIHGGSGDACPRMMFYGTDLDAEKTVTGGIELRAYKNGTRHWGSGGTSFWTLDDSSAETRRFSVTSSGAIKLFPLLVEPGDADVADSDAGAPELQNGSLYFDAARQHLRLVATNSWNELGFAGGEADRDFTAKTIHSTAIIATPTLATPTELTGTIWTGSDGITRVRDQNGSWSALMTDYPAWQDLRVSLLQTNSGGTNAPTPTLVRANGSSQGVFAYAFDKNTEQELYTSIQLPHDCWKTVVCPHIHWMPTDGTVGTVTWGIEYSLTNHLATVTAQTTIATVTAQTKGHDRQHLITEFPDINISGAKDSAVMLLRIYRVAADASDTYNASVFGTDFDLHYQVRNRGSLTLYGDN